MLPPRILNPAKALRTLRKTPVLLGTLLQGVSNQQAATLTDGPDGWNAVFLMGHMRDYERILRQRVEAILAETHPTLPVSAPNDVLAAENNYAHANLSDMVAEWYTLRQAFIARLEEVQGQQWLRTGLHPQQGEGTLLDVAVNAGLHDIDHLEQLARILAPRR